MMTPFGTFLMLALSGLGGHGHHGPKEGCCAVCGVETRAVLAEIQCLQASPRGHRREDAAHDLRKVDWHCHPEVVSALATALLNDGKDDVREEAAESLGKLAAGTPEAHAALTMAAEADPDHGVRHEARKALKKLKGRCAGACQVCGPAPTGAAPPVIPGPPVILPDDQPPARLVLPPDLGPLDLAPAPAPAPTPPAGSPFVAPRAEDVPLEPPLN